MNWRAVLAITRKDLKVVSRTRGVMLPMIVLPVVLLVLLPGGIALLTTNESMAAEIQRESAVFFENMPEGMLTEVAAYENDLQRVLYLMLVYQFAPMYLILPLMVSAVIGADSFAGEKERKTLEALIYSPTTDGELYLGKMLSCWLPAVAVGIGGALVYGLVANLTAGGIMGEPLFPNAMWLVLALWVAPGAAGLGLAAMVLVSSRVRSFQEAYQLGSIVVLPIVVLFIAQFAGVLYFSIPAVLGLGLLLWLVDAALLFYGARSFQRSELIAQL